MTLLIERALFVVAPQDSGKSTQLRSIFLDHRFGMDGKIPKSSEQTNLPDTYYISNERFLYLRLTSPHENDENPDEFISKTRNKMVSGRWCFAGPFQVEAFKRMPDVVESVRLFAQAFEPERVRVVFLSPTRHGVELNVQDHSDDLLAIDHVELVRIDARHREANGLFLADFFDFT
ncbi:MAG: hypothetical protein ACLP2P_15470 [Desulfobaccales bacterium]